MQHFPSQCEAVIISQDGGIMTTIAKSSFGLRKSHVRSFKSKAKGAEGKLESRYGSVTGEKGHQINGKVKQIQVKAMNATENPKESSINTKKKLNDAGGHGAEDLS